MSAAKKARERERWRGNVLYRLELKNFSKLENSLLQQIVEIVGSLGRDVSLTDPN